MISFAILSLSLSIIGLCCSCFIITYIIQMIITKQHLAYFGDKEAALHLLLPCYKPLLRSLWSINIILIIMQLIIILLSNNSIIQIECIKYCQMCCIVIHTIPAILLCQPSVSRLGFWRTGFTIIPWWILSTITWFLSINFTSYIGLLIFTIISAIPPFIISFLMLIGVIPSRIQLGSRSNRGCIEFLLIHSFLYLISLILSIIYSNFPIQITFGIFIFLSNQIFPVVLYFCLLADTKFWRGLGKHNAGGLISSSSSTTTTNKPSLPELTMTVVANEFQTLISDISSYFIDFAFIQVGPLVGSGASADVYLGQFKKKPVVLKISTPPEFTSVELLEIRKEALIHSKLNHPCIVKFIGVCIRPPQIGMVVEYCDNGNLKESLQNQSIHWTPLRKIHAILDACSALQYLHSMGYMHRDIKAENFFVTNTWKIKLGDFGESIELKSYHQVHNLKNNNNNNNNDLESGNHNNRDNINDNEREAETRKMTILGTIAYMAPELVEGRKYYNELIDVYALTITLWQIWTGLEPYADVNTFSLYNLILSGTHPPLPDNSPEGFNEILQASWESNPDKRINSKELLEDMTIVANKFISKLNEDNVLSEKTDSISPLYSQYHPHKNNHHHGININNVFKSLLPLNITQSNHKKQQQQHQQHKLLNVDDINEFDNNMNPGDDNNDENDDDDNNGDVDNYNDVNDVDNQNSNKSKSNNNIKNNNIKNNMVISNEALEMLGNSSFIDDYSSSDVDDQSVSSSGASPNRLFNGFQYKRSRTNNNPIFISPLHKVQNKSKKFFHNQNSVNSNNNDNNKFNINKKLHFSNNLQTNDNIDEIKSNNTHNNDTNDIENNENNQNDENDENEDDNNNVDSVQMDLYQSYARNSTTETKKNPIFKIFSNKRNSFW